jgi:hypothetical protein
MTYKIWATTRGTIVQTSVLTKHNIRIEDTQRCQTNKKTIDIDEKKLLISN